MPQIVLNNLVIRYPHLVTPWSASPNIEPAYNCQLIIPQDWPEWDIFQATVQQAIQEKWGASTPQNLKMPWMNKYLQPATQADGPYAGCYYFNASDKENKPGVLGPDAKKLSDLQIKELIFSGCIVNALIGLFGYAAGPGIGVGLNGIQLVNNQVERIAEAGRNVEDAFKPVPGAPTPTAPPFQGGPPPGGGSAFG